MNNAQRVKQGQREGGAALAHDPLLPRTVVYRRTLKKSGGMPHGSLPTACGSQALSIRRQIVKWLAEYVARREKTINVCSEDSFQRGG